MVRSIISDRNGVALNGEAFAAGDTIRFVPRRGIVSVAKFRSRPEDRGFPQSARDDSERHLYHSIDRVESMQPPQPPRRRRFDETWGQDPQD